MLEKEKLEASCFLREEEEEEEEEAKAAAAAAAALVGIRDAAPAVDAIANPPQYPKMVF